MSVDDLKFSKSVSDVRQTPNAPVYQKKESIQPVSAVPVAESFRQYATASNWMSDIGSKVASGASNAIAQKLGGEAGKNPHGDLFPAITDFDKHYAESYSTQAHASLGLEANKLITDSNLELANAARLTPELIAQSQAKISEGLKNIYSQAPGNIRPQLESTYGQAQLNQAEHLTHKMVSEQHEDRRNNTILSNDKNAQLAHSLAASNDPASIAAAENLIKTTEALNQSAVAGNIGFTPQQAKVGTDTVRQSYNAGRLQGEYERANSQKKGSEYLASLAKKPDWLSDADYMPATQDLLQYVNRQSDLKNENESLIMTKFQTDLIRGIEIPGLRLEKLRNDLSPENYEKTLLGYYKYTKKNAHENEQIALLNGGFEKPEVFAKATDDIKNKTFDEKVRNYMQDTNVSLSEAESHVASQAAGAIPHFTDTINAQMKSLDPAQIQDGISKMEYMYAAEKGDNLDGVTHEAKLFAASYQQAIRSLPPEEAAKITHDKYYNFKEGEKEIIIKKWNTFKKQIEDSPGSSLGYYSNIVGFDPSKLSDPIAFENAAAMTMESNFFTSHADLEGSKKVLVRDLRQSYGESNVNGINQITYLPIEKVLNLPSNEEEKEYTRKNPLFSIPKNEKYLNTGFLKPFSAVGLIQDDIMESVSKQLEPINKDYKEGNSLYHFEIEPRPSIDYVKKNRYSHELNTEGEDRLKKYSNGYPIVIHRVWKNGTRETYNLMVKANPNLTQLNNGSDYKGAWDVIAVSDTGGYKPLASLTPGINQQIYYRPAVEHIRLQYLKHYGELNG